MVFLSGSMDCDGKLLAEAETCKLVFRLEEVILPSINKPTAFGQCDSPWRNKKYSPTGTWSFCRGGCLVTSLASLATWVGYDTDPERFARSIPNAFEANYLSHPTQVVDVYNRLQWFKTGVYYSSRYDRRETSLIDWHSRPADIKLLKALLDQHPVILEVDFKPLTEKIDNHFVLGWKYIPDPAGGLEDDLEIMDPQTGTYTSILTYFNPRWLNAWMRAKKITKVQRTLMGARVYAV